MFAELRGFILGRLLRMRSRHSCILIKVIIKVEIILMYCIGLESSSVHPDLE